MTRRWLEHSKRFILLLQNDLIEQPIRERERTKHIHALKQLLKSMTSKLEFCIFTMVRLMVTFGTGLWPHGRSKFSKQSNSLICRRCRHQNFSASYEMMAEWVAKKAVSNITLPCLSTACWGMGCGIAVCFFSTWLRSTLRWLSVYFVTLKHKLRFTSIAAATKKSRHTSALSFYLRNAVSR